MFSEKFPEKVKVRQVVSQRSRVCWRQVFKENWVAINYLRPK
jgi:hypothetical protein